MKAAVKGLFVFVISFIFLSAQEPTGPATPAADLGAAIAGMRLPGMGGTQAPEAYDKVITKEAKSKAGLFTVHEVNQKYYYEIPKTEFNREFLMVTQVARTTLGAGYGGQFLGERVVRWERNGNKINLRQVNYDVVADPKTPISLAVKAANNDAIIMTFPIAAFGKEKGAAEVKTPEPNEEDAAEAPTPKDEAKAKDATADTAKADPAKAAAAAREAAIRRARAIKPFKETGREPSIIIDVTRLFTSDVFELSARQRLNATMMDSSRSYIERISPYPENIEVEATVTYSRTTSPFGGATANPFAAGGMRPGSGTVVLHHSMVKLPEHPMTPRLFDERVGYFSVHQLDFGRDEHRAPRRTYITRWRLEKKDPTAELSEPVKPIVYYIDAATPTKWVPYMKAGVESWQKAFEAAGFKNAIIAKLAPTPEQDPNFSPEDIRYSVIRWLPSTIENAVGPHISDPRTGEILNADIQFYHNVMNLQRDWYFLQVGPLDPRASKLPLPDELMGRLVQFVCAHEVGHTLGFQHNMKASSMYPAEKVHDKEWVKRMGHAPSIMDYSRFNYVAQPEDGIDVADLVPGIGPYDVWATRWGYKPIAKISSPDDEKATLDEWSREQDKTPWLRFSTPGAGGSDPGELTEAVGDADAVQSTGYGLKNLQRVAKMLIPATTTQKGEAYEDLSELYGRMLGQWTLEMNHVAAVVGGFQSQQKNIGQEGVIFTPVAKRRQAAAVNFLVENAFATPTWAINKEILRRIEPFGAINRVGNAQRSIMSNLLSSPRFARLVEQEALDGTAAYTPADFLTAVRRGIWHELEYPQVSIDAYRRQLQRAFLDLANTKVNGASASLPAGLPAGFPVAFFASSGDEKEFYRLELRSLNTSIGKAIRNSDDRETRAHLEAAQDQIARILDPKFSPSGNGGGPEIRIFAEDWLRWAGFSIDTPLAADDNQNWDQMLNCWPDYAIRP